MNRALSLIVGLICLLGALFAAHRSLEFRQRGEVVPGVVLEQSSSVEPVLAGREHGRRMTVRYTPLEGGEPLELQTGITSAWFVSPEPGELLAVRYLPERPADARMDSLFLDIAGPVGLLMLGFVALTGWLGPAAHGSSRMLWRGSRR